MSKEFMQNSKKYGSPIYDAKGFPIELHDRVKLGDMVTWLGRKSGSSSNDDKFCAGQSYSVVMIYPKNFDLELELPNMPPHITIRAGDSEYQLSK
jgi:hypothetical protein